MKRTLILLGIFLFLSAGILQADEVVLKNGDQLTGTVVSMADGKLTIKTDHSGEILIDTASIASIATDESAELLLKSGERLKGKLGKDGEGVVVIDSEGTGEKHSVSWEKIEAVNPPEKKPVSWNGSVNLAANKSSGNTDRTAISLGAQAKRKTEQDTFTLRFLFNYAEEDNIRTERSTFGKLKYDYKFSRKLYGYLSVELLSDEFKDLDLRTIAGGGLGYQILEEEEYNLSGELGVAHVSENRDVGDDDDYVTGRIAMDGEWTISETITLADSFVIFPSLEESDYLYRNEATLSNALGAGWSMNLSNIVEYDSDPPNNVKKRDVMWLLGLQYTFGN